LSKIMPKMTKQQVANRISTTPEKLLGQTHGIEGRFLEKELRETKTCERDVRDLCKRHIGVIGMQEGPRHEEDERALRLKMKWSRPKRKRNSSSARWNITSSNDNGASQMRRRAGNLVEAMLSCQ
ncbi:hypothetical protein KCU92_g380, partial [Aureobasidium melanogenum]